MNEWYHRSCAETCKYTSFCKNVFCQIIKILVKFSTRVQFCQLVFITGDVTLKVHDGKVSALIVAVTFPLKMSRWNKKL